MVGRTVAVARGKLVSFRNQRQSLRTDTETAWAQRFSEAFQTMLASEAVLRRDWDRPEEDEAWASL